MPKRKAGKFPERFEREFGERRRREREAVRALNGLLRFWKVCDAACRRAGVCAGDPQACFGRFWPHVPEELKIFLRAGIQARLKKMSAAEAVRAADAEVERWRALTAPAPAQPAQPGGSGLPAPPPDSPAPQPRLRRL